MLKEQQHKNISMEYNTEPIYRLPWIYIVNLSLTKDQRQFNGAGVVFSTNNSETTGYPHLKNELRLIPFIKTNSKWIVDLNVNYKTIKLLEVNIRQNLDDLRYGDNFLDTTSKAWSMKENIDNLEFIKIKTLFSVF